MSFLDRIGQYVKLKQFLQFVGYMLIIGGYTFRDSVVFHHKFGIPVAFVGLGVSMAGFLYDVIYP